MNDSGNPIVDKSFEFAVKIVNLAKNVRYRKEYELARQILRCGTSVGANVAESQRSQSDRDFMSKMYIAAKEAHETEYWLRLLHRTNVICDKEFQSAYDDLKEIIRILMSITRTLESKIGSDGKC